jgi:L-threonylcarbamoyladenylate synthase
MKKKEKSKLKKDLEKAAEILKKGGVVIFPTDTFYGIGCRMDDEEVIERVYKIKQRPRNQPTLVVISDLVQLKKFAKKIPQNAKKLIKKYWPGPLTLVLRCRVEKIPKILRGGKDTLAFRLPNYPLLISLVKKVGVPILAPSANFKGEKPPKNFADIDKNFAKQVDFILRNNGLLGIESTIIDCTKSPPKILRQGALQISV